ncbi:MAG: isocitrate/isopropylmalate dehydrogenase family protein, partial [Clostridia bacterium]|nr:isocitrate/isopropylmalate dehydrogenase family protein [Clostridia bacterium]
MMENQIKNAVQHFEELLREQIARAQNLNAAKKQKDENKTVIGLIDGDGIGPIIMAEAKRALEKLLADEIAGGSIELRVIEGLTIENRLALGQAVPDDVMAAIKECDVLLKGPTTTPSGGKMESANVSLRRALDLYANVRPVSVPEEGIDWIFFRENTEGE